MFNSGSRLEPFPELVNSGDSQHASISEVPISRGRLGTFLGACNSRSRRKPIPELVNSGDRRPGSFPEASNVFKVGVYSRFRCFLLFSGLGRGVKLRAQMFCVIAVCGAKFSVFAG